MSLSVGDSICLEPHNDEDYTSPTHASTTQAPKPTAAPVPSSIANGTNENCAQYYFVQEGDYCNQIIVKFGISLADFLFLNQGINAECTNLMAEDSYCVAPVGPINMYPGHPDYVDPTSTIPDIPFSDLPKATFTPPAITDESGPATTSTSTASTLTTDTTAKPTETELPIRDGAAEGCTKYYAVVPPQTCQEVLDANNLTIAEFYA
ncbi:hypothetical protein Neosp_013674, partial [[Neocosmospora] mangrovei]